MVTTPDTRRVPNHFPSSVVQSCDAARTGGQRCRFQSTSNICWSRWNKRCMPRIPKFASQMQGSTVRDRLRRRIMLGILAVLAGLVLVVLGVVNEAVWLGAIGFALMVGGPPTP